MRMNKKGFSLAELLTVIVIIAVLAAMSSPFIRQYLRDANNDKAKIALQMIAQGYKNFKTDYPNVDASISNSALNTIDSVKCELVNRKGENSPGVLKGCRYIQGVNWDAYTDKYTFYAGNSCCTHAPEGSLACMLGMDAKAGNYGPGYCAWVDRYGDMSDNLKIEEEKE